MTIDLEAQEIHGPDGGVVKFDIDAFRKHCMINGLDDIGITMKQEAEISAFESRRADFKPTTI
jgi:3-isopropylmalate/(R)-2-methylmalate dehydratase small subunit